jgi:hypothetical protein
MLPAISSKFATEIMHGEILPKLRSVCSINVQFVGHPQTQAALQANGSTGLKKQR